MPPELLEHFKKKLANKAEKKEDTDSSKRAEALSKAKAKIEEKNAASRAKKKTIS